jgi:hypothetical protein
MSPSRYPRGHFGRSRPAVAERLEGRTLLSGTVFGTVYRDLNGNFVPDAGDEGVTGAVVYADFDDDATLDAGEPSARPGADGRYQLTVPSEEWLILRVDPVVIGNLYQDTPRRVGTREVIVPEGGSRSNQDFTYALGIGVQGRVFEDLNGNLVRDAGEPGVGGWTVEVRDGTPGGSRPVLSSARTDADGNYAAVALRAGFIYVEPVVPAGWTIVEPSPLLRADSTGETVHYDVAVVRGTIVTGVVYTDASLDGARREGDTGLAGWTVFIDANGNGLRDAGEREDVTDAAGVYRLGPLDPGGYTVRAVPAAGFAPVWPSVGAREITADEPRRAAGVDFGFADFGIVAGRVFNDNNGNGTKDFEESSVAFPQIFLDADRDGVRDEAEPTYDTAADGTYALRLPPGEYAIGWAVPEGRIQTVPFGGGSRVVRIETGRRIDAADFASTPGPRTSTEVYVRGSAWTGAFMSSLESWGFGNLKFGYQLGSTPGRVIPWMNLDWVVLRLSPDSHGDGIPPPSALEVESHRFGIREHPAIAVAPVAGDPLSFVFTLARPLGGDTPDAGRNGDRLTLRFPNSEPDGRTKAFPLNILQGDVNGNGTVLADDFAAVKKRFFKSTYDPFTGADTDYSVFHDVNASGAILANDFAEVKKRFFNTLPPVRAAAALPLRRATPVRRELFGDVSVR